MEGSIAHSGTRDVREPASHVSDSSVERTNGEGVLPSATAEVTMSSRLSLMCRRPSRETRLRPRRLEIAIVSALKNSIGNSRPDAEDR
jgi:hypothetical protein